MERTKQEEILDRGTPPQVRSDGPQHQETERGRQPVVNLFDLPPTPAELALVIVNGDEQTARVSDQGNNVFESGPHGAGVMQHTPGVNDIEPAERFQQSG